MRCKLTRLIVCLIFVEDIYTVSVKNIDRARYVLYMVLGITRVQRDACITNEKRYTKERSLVYANYCRWMQPTCGYTVSGLTCINIRKTPPRGIIKSNICKRRPGLARAASREQLCADLLNFGIGIVRPNDTAAYIPRYILPLNDN